MTVTYSADLREAQFRVRIDELRERADKLADQNGRLRNQVQRKNLRIVAMREDIAELQSLLRHARRELASA